ncbi:MAG: DNA-binding protein [Thermoprotei archaeon]|nr:DNA-binding protein [Thermoprotei archaeon]
MNDSTQEYSHTGREALILDTGAIITGLPLMTPIKCYTTTKVIEEVKDRESRERLERLLEAGRIEVVDPKPEYIDKVRKNIKTKNLSETDITIIALALQLKDQNINITVATDDYTIQKTLKTRYRIKATRIRYKGITP